MNEFEERREDDGPAGEGAPQGGSADQRSSTGQGPGDYRDRSRRRGRRGRGGGAQRFGGAPRGATGAGPRLATGGGAPARDDEESSQARELAAYERRQQQRGRQWRGPGWVAGTRPVTGGAAPFRASGTSGFRPQRPIGMRGPRRAGGASYTEQIRRVTAGPRAQAAPSHEAGEPIAGPHAVLEAIRAGRTVKRLFVSNERGTRTGAVNELITEAQQRRIFVRFVEPMEIQRLSPVENHQGVVAIVEGKAGVELDELLLHLDTLSTPALVLVIDSLQDPQNFGVLLRSAEGTGVDGVIIPRHRAVGLTPAVAKTSSGASEHLMIADVANLRQAIDALREKGVWVVGTDETGDLLYDEVDYRGATAIVVGGEAEGIRRLVLEGCDQVVRIPMEGQVASLNAAAAGTVVLYEALRQRRRNVPPADTRTPPPVRETPLTPQEETMADEGEGPAATEASGEAERDAGATDEPAVPRSEFAAVDEDETAAEESAAVTDAVEAVAPPTEEAEATVAAPKKRISRAKSATTAGKTTTPRKTTTARKTTTRKKPAD